MSAASLSPGATLGVLGGGQLGRMFAAAAARMGYRVHVLAPEEHTPCGQVAHAAVAAAYDDEDALAAFARGVDVVTYEFENVPARTVEVVERHAPVRPSGKLLHAAQDRLREKASLAALGLPVAEHAALESAGELEAAAAAVGFPAILKTAGGGYDGKGQRKVTDLAGLRAAWTELRAERAVLERVVAFERELSVVAARGLDGAVAAYAPFANDHENHVLDVTSFPAGLSRATTDEAQSIARAVLEAFDVVGVLCVELFLLEGGGLVLNEVAPRPHNSGHVTIDAHETSQFEQQVRAVCGLPLGSVAPLAPAGAMANLLGDLWTPGEPDWAAVLAEPGVRLHLYGKERAKPGRKMGHLSVLAEDAERARARVRSVRARLPRSV